MRFIVRALISVPTTNFPHHTKKVRLRIRRRKLDPDLIGCGCIHPRWYQLRAELSRGEVPAMFQLGPEANSRFVVNSSRPTILFTKNGLANNSDRARPFVYVKKKLSSANGIKAIRYRPLNWAPWIWYVTFRNNYFSQVVSRQRKFSTPEDTNTMCVEEYRV